MHSTAVAFTLLLAVSNGLAGRDNGAGRFLTGRELATEIDAGVRGRIVGGFYPDYKAVPYYASLWSSKRGGLYCGGSILNDRWILTAGSCNGSTEVRVGSNFLNDSNAVVYAVSKEIRHPGYDRSSLDHNVALVKTSAPIAFDDYVVPIVLATDDACTGRALVCGMGLTTSYGNLTEYMMCLNTTVLSAAECTALMTPWEVYHNREMCTDWGAGSGTCYRDAGGPLVSSGGQLCGIVSYGEPCARGYPDVYVRALFYSTWIGDTMAAN